MSAVVLDAGAFIAWERGALAVRVHLEAARRLGLPVVTTSPVVTQVWRDGPRQVLLSTLLRSVDVRAPALSDAQAAGTLCRNSRTNDAVDALVVVAAPSGSAVLTSDPDDIAALVAVSHRRIAVIKV